MDHGDDNKRKMQLRLEAMKRELAAKSKKLEKSKCGARVKAYVRQKVKEQNALDDMTNSSCQKGPTTMVGRDTSDKNAYLTTIKKQPQTDIYPSPLETVDNSQKRCKPSFASEINAKNSIIDSCELKDKLVCVKNNESREKKVELPLRNNTRSNIKSTKMNEKKRLSLMNEDCGKKSSIANYTNTSEITSSIALVSNNNMEVSEERLTGGSLNYSSKLSTPGGLDPPNANESEIIITREIKTIVKPLHNIKVEERSCKSAFVLAHNNPKHDDIQSGRHTLNSASGDSNCEDSFFITPSFQSLNEKVDKNIKSKFPMHADRISNADFLNILGVSQIDHKGKTKSDLMCSFDKTQQQNHNCENQVKSNPTNRLAVRDKDKGNTDIAQGSDLDSDTRSTSSIEYTELDVIPFSQFELTEDFLSDTPCSETYPNVRKGKSKFSGSLIKRKSPRLSSGLLINNSSQTSSLNRKESANSLSSYIKSKPSLAAKKKAVAVMSIFQFLLDEAKKKMSHENFQLPSDFAKLIEGKINLSTSEKHKDNELDGENDILGPDQFHSRDANTHEFLTNNHLHYVDHGDKPVPHCKEPVENSFVQSSYLRSPTDKISGKLDKIAFLNCKSLLRPSILQESLENHFTVEKNQDNPSSQVDTSNKSLEKAASEKTQTLVKMKEFITVPETEVVDQEVQSPVNKLLSQSFQSSVTCSSTPKLGKHIPTKVLSIHEAPSPIVEPRKNQSLAKKTVDASRRLPLSASYDDLCSPTSTPKGIEPFSPIWKSQLKATRSEEKYDHCETSDIIDKKTQCKEYPRNKKVIGEKPSSDALFSCKTESHFPLRSVLDVNASTHKEKDVIHTTEVSKCNSSKFDKQNVFETSGGKSPFSKYLEESVLMEESQNGLSFQSPTHVSAWQKIPKTSSTPLQIFEKSCKTSGLLSSPVFTPSRTNRSKSRAKSSVQRKNLSLQSKKTLKFEGCFQSCSEDAVVQLLHGKLFVDQDGWKRYIVSIQASALTIWIQDDKAGNDWSPELDWRLSSDMHVLHACILPVSEKITIAASCWEKNEPCVTVFVYDFSHDDTFRFNIPYIESCQLKRISEIHLCVCPPELLLGITSNTYHTIRKVRFQSSLKNVASIEVFNTLQGKLISLSLCQGQANACVSLTWDQRITIWNVLHRIVLKTIIIPSHFPCLTSIVDVKVIKGLLLLTAAWRVEEMGDCGGVVVLNPHSGRVYKTTVCSIPNTGWKSSEKVKKEKSHIFAVSSTGSMSWWDGKDGKMIGYRQSNIATCVAAMEHKHVVIGEIHGCVHLYYSMC